MASKVVKVKKKAVDIRVSMMDADMDFPVQVTIGPKICVLRPKKTILNITLQDGPN